MFTSVAEVEQTPACGDEQPRGDEVDETVAATTSDSAVENVDFRADDNNNNDESCSVDVLPVNDDAETKSPTESTTFDDTETVELRAPECMIPESLEDADMSSDTSMEVNEVKGDGGADLQETSSEAKTGCLELPEVLGCQADSDESLSGTEERTAADEQTDADVVEAADNTLEHLSIRQQQQLESDSDAIAGTQRENEIASESGKSRVAEKCGAQENDMVEMRGDNRDQELDKAGEKVEVDHLEAKTDADKKVSGTQEGAFADDTTDAGETRPAGTDYHPEAVEVFRDCCCIFVSDFVALCKFAVLSYNRSVQ